MTPGCLHATCVAIDGRAVLIEGPSGTGKSDLALRLIDRGAMLVSDDQTCVVRRGDRAFASAPRPIRGQIEVRGLGILSIDVVDDVAVALVVRLGISVERMPPEYDHRDVAGIAVPSVALDAYQASAPVKVELALKRVIGR